MMYPESVEYLNRQGIILKMRQWTLGATVDLGFAVCDWLVSDLYVYLSLVFSACYHWWICLLVWLLSSFSFYYFKNFFFYFNNFILFYFIFSFFLFFLPFLLSRVVDTVLVLWPGVRPEPLRWESWGQDIGTPETSWPHIISIGKSSPRDLRLNNKTQLHSMTSKLQGWTCQTTSKTGTQLHPLAERLPKFIKSSQMPQNTPWDAVLPTSKTRSSLIDQNTGTSALHLEAYTTHWTKHTHWGQTPKKWELQICSLRKGDHKHSKLSKMRRQRNTQQMKEQGKTKTKQMKRK